MNADQVDMNIVEEPEKVEKIKQKRERKEYMKKYYAEHKDDLLNRSKKRYTPRKKKNENIENIEIEKIENIETEKI